ncbi:MAG TPA: hypothetical protein VHO26_05645 [Propionibacteriaceae bacterium]|nr:hypothetical protein [Propionibacteriaceae bacterium]
MKRRSMAVAALGAAAALAFAAPTAYAWDCINVSASQQGQQQMTRSGNWEYVTIDDMVSQAVGMGWFTPDQGQCIESAWLAAGEPASFAMGVGVAGAHGAGQSGHMTASDFFELAKDAPTAVVSDGHGVDHFETAVAGALATCSVSLPGE